MAHRGLFWFRNDLRLADNPALAATAEQVDELVCVYVVDERDFERNRYGFASLGEKRWAFIAASLHALNAQLQALGQRLLVFLGDPVDVVARLCHEGNIGALGASDWHGYRECRQLAAVHASLPDMRVMTAPGSTLFDAATVDRVAGDVLKGPFTPFFRAMSEQAFRPLAVTPSELPQSRWLPLDDGLPRNPQSVGRWRGGADAGQEHLHNYIHVDQALHHYARTRNDFSGWDHSSKLSAWLAQGCLSPLQIMRDLDHLEGADAAQESVEKLRYELFWREFFQWHALRSGPRLFHFQGINRRAPLTSYYPQRLKAWCEGDTPYPIVNACIRELRTTGYLSNRGRQLVASCLINELAVDWRYGAAFFEQELIDYDVAVNWGNWQYIAGVGTDPRGGRHFKLREQAHRYDPDGQYIQRWAPNENWGEWTDAVDMVDWPA